MTTLRDLIERNPEMGDWEVDHHSYWYEGEPVVPDTSIAGFACEGNLDIGDTFTIQRYIALRDETYVVTDIPDLEAENDEYKVERAQDDPVMCPICEKYPADQHNGKVYPCAGCEAYQEHERTTL